MCGADREAPLALIAQLGGQAADARRFLQDPQRPLDDLLPFRGNAREIAPLTHEDLEAELVFQQLDLLADARLRGVQLLCRRGDVEAALRHRGEVT